MATILISKCGDFQATIIDIPKPSSRSGKKFKLLETGEVFTWHKTAINVARAYLRSLDGAQPKPKKKKKNDRKVTWDCGRVNTLTISSNRLISLAEEIKKFKEEQNEKQRNKASTKTKAIRSKRNVSGVKLDRNWRSVYGHGKNI